jgi:uncharacterized protein (UPF0210 family)
MQVLSATETLTGKPFGSPTTLSTCSFTKVIKNLDVKSCGYSGLMLPIIGGYGFSEDGKGNYTVEELLLFSSVSGTGLDVGSCCRRYLERNY